MLRAGLTISCVSSKYDVRFTRSVVALDHRVQLEMEAFGSQVPPKKLYFFTVQVSESSWHPLLFIHPFSFLGCTSGPQACSLFTASAVASAAHPTKSHGHHLHKMMDGWMDVWIDAYG